MKSKDKTSQIIILLFILDFLFAVMSIPFATSIVETIHPVDSFLQRIESFSSVAFLLFIITNVVFVIISLMKESANRTKSIIDPLIKYLQKTTDLKFAHNSGIYEGTLNEQKITVRLLTAGGTTVPSSFLNISIYHTKKLNIGLSLRTKNVTLFYKREHRDILSKKIFIKDPLLWNMDIYAVKKYEAETMLKDRQVSESLGKLLGNFKSLGIETKLMDKIFGTGSGISMNDDILCIRIIEELVDKKQQFELIKNLIISGIELSKISTQNISSPASSYHLVSS